MLKRELGLLEATFYGVSIILGAGIFALIGKAAGLAGPSLWVSFLISAFVAIFTGLSYAELSSMYPKAGAEFVYVKKAYGSKFWAFLMGWFLIFALGAGTATVSLAFSGYLLELFGLNQILKPYIAVLLIALLSYINFYGIRESSRLNILFTLIVILSLLFIIFLGLGKTPTSLTKFFQAPKGLEGVFSAATLVFFAYLGFEDVANISEETKNPRKIIPFALLLSIIITTLIYVLVSLSILNLASWEELATSQAPLALAASKVLGNKAFVFISISALFATAGTSLGLLIATSRMIYGMAKENSLPKALSRIHKKRKTPYIAIIVIMLLSIAFIFMEKIEKVAQITSLCSLLAFVAVNLSLIHLRFMKPEIKRPFKTPLNIKNFSLTAFLGAISCLALIGFFDLITYIFSLAVFFVGIIFFLLYKKGKIG
jgi:APA family basic amino acid/polyamine antiporter